MFDYYFIGLVEYDDKVTANLSGFNNPNELGLIKAEFLRRHRGIEKFEYGVFSVSDNDFVIMLYIWISSMLSFISDFIHRTTSEMSI